MRGLSYVCGAVGLAAGSLASETAFSVHDDLFAFPQYGVEFLNSYILEADAIDLLAPEPTPRADAADGRHGHDGPLWTDVDDEGAPDEGPSRPGTYELLALHGFPHLCFIPDVTPASANDTTEATSAADRAKELDRAVSRASELLQGMASNQCLYYSTGWWTYSFCYNAQITQFHALPPGSNGRVWPPQEDPTTPSYVLGKFTAPKPSAGPGPGPAGPAAQTLSTEVKMQAETNYLVQRLEGGTPCDLTGADRKVEVQFHCNPQLTDRIGWIKETATCAYLMVVYTPRLCNDIAFQPPKETRAHSIQCREIVAADEVAAWEARHRGKAPAPPTLDDGHAQQVVLGRVAVGAMKYVGREGKKLERGRIVLTQDEKAETVVMQKNGQISSLSRAELKRLDLKPDDVDAFRKELQKLAGTKDWKIELLDDVDGHIQLRGVVATDDDGVDDGDTPGDSNHNKKKAEPADGGDGDGDGHRENRAPEEKFPDDA